MSINAQRGMICESCKDLWKLDEPLYPWKRQKIEKWIQMKVLRRLKRNIRKLYVIQKETVELKNDLRWMVEQLCN